ncbi:ABC transporter ATP-binding protein [Spirosoma horti]
MLHIKKFRKVYNRYVALQVDNVVISPGIYWLQGVNGSGKSTLLKALAGIIAFEGDSILHQQISLKQQPTAYRRLVNFAEAEPIFPDFLTGVELVDLFRAAKKAPPHQQDYYLESMQMTTFIGDPVSTYSSGMLKKLALVLAFLGQPACILLDEPLTTLDADSLPVLYTWIANQYYQQGTTFLLSSHQSFTGEALPVLQNLFVEHNTLRLPV